MCRIDICYTRLYAFIYRLYDQFRSIFILFPFNPINFTLGIGIPLRVPELNILKTFVSGIRAVPQKRYIPA